MTEAIAFGAASAALAVLLSGLRRLRWRYRAILGAGVGIAFATLALAMTGADPSTLVLLAAVGGGLAVMGSERGERDRERRSAAILGGSSVLNASSRSISP